MKISFAKPQLPSEGALVAGVLEGKGLTGSAKAIDDLAAGGIARAVAAAKFTGKKDQTLTILAPAGSGLGRVVLVGLGKAESIDSQAAQSFGGTGLAAVLTSGDTSLAIACDDIPGLKIAPESFAAQAAFGARLRSYRFGKYFTKEKKDDKPSIKKVTVLTAASGAKAAFAPLDAVADGVFLTRDVVSEPANVIHPESLADECRKLSALGVEVEVLGEKQMKKLGMGALLGVGQGSDRESQLVVMRWQGAKDAEAAPLALIGKGVCFDSGGISIKPAGGMEEMKWDMAGAGAVIGAMKALAGRKAKANVVGIVGLVENMPSGNAQRPGDVVTSMSGQTIEVINTDAEGRLVLCDALWYAKERFKPSAMIDLATLTGAIIIALGNEYAGLFASQDKLAERITAAGGKVGEPVWRLPLGDAYDKQLKSDIADMKNVGGREGGSITAAQFLKRFVADTPWAHIDIAGTAWTKKDSATCPKGASAFGVRLLDQLVADHYEDK
ncbi:putative cytosol aminopeptidase [Magnetospirillum sp. LM-5]|uniref:leucyl aminopeptidase n=1 Tax=Magnetospirillum sp. LM-5 TaxID=2681466 RepID=UPI001385D40F|nr:leucyl aminopeptidase [Magnetospirillum sp. LM-5]CAA7619958.1 putative cytosol aminopeptidase [Magnetospirillum sp. LM-5]